MKEKYKITYNFNNIFHMKEDDVRDIFNADGEITKYPILESWSVTADLTSNFTKIITTEPKWCESKIKKVPRVFEKHDKQWH